MRTLRSTSRIRLSAALVFLLIAGSVRLGAATIRGVIRENARGGPPIANVQVSAMEGANPVSSHSNGTFVLEFPGKQPGETVQLIVQKPGMVVVNDRDLFVTLSKDAKAALRDPLLLCRPSELEEWTSRFYGLKSSEDKRKLYDEALEVYRKSAREDREDRDKKRELREDLGLVASMLNGRGVLLRDQNKMEQAREDFDEALDICRKLARDEPSIYLPDVAKTLNNLGILHRAQNRMKEARKAFSEALGIYEDLAKTNPEQYEQKIEFTRSLLDDVGEIQRP